MTIVCHPENPNYPESWILRKKGSMQNPVFPGSDRVTISEDEPIRLRYRLIVHRGSMEGEVIDSQTGEQIGAVIQTQKGSRLSLAGVKKWGDAKAVMDEWAKRFRKRLDEAH